MCGIVGVVNFDDKPVNKLVKKQYFNQKSRGSNGFGLFDYSHKNMVREPQEKDIMKWLKRYPSNNILFHHRLPTSTVNVKNACHPFSTKDFFRTNYILVHNGIISNDWELKGEHEKLGIKYSSEQDNGDFNDSEALLWDVALYLEGKQDKLTARGSIAFVCIAIGKGNKHDRLWFGRNNGNPLNLITAKDGLMISSEGEGEVIDTDTLYCFDYVNHKFTQQECHIPRWSTYVENSGYTRSEDNGFYGYVQGADGVWRPATHAERELAEEIEEFQAEEFESDGYQELEATEKEGKKLVRFHKYSEVASHNDMMVMYNRIMYEAEGWVSDARLVVDYEHDCVALYHDKLRRKNKNTQDAVYTLNLYCDVSDKIEALDRTHLREFDFQKDTRQQLEMGA